MTNLLRELNRRTRIFILRARGFTGPMAKRWVDEQLSQRSTYKHLPCGQRRIARRRGLLPATAARWLVTGGDRSDLVSERDYYLAQPLNGIYSRWVRDHVTARRIFSPFASLFQPLHYHLVCRDKDVLVIPHSSKAKSFGNSLDDVERVVRERGSVAVGQAAWSEPDRRDLEQWEIRIENGFWVVEGEQMDRETFLAWVRARSGGRGLVLLEEDESADQSLILEVFVSNPSGADPKITDVFLSQESSSQSESGRGLTVSRVDPRTGCATEARVRVARDAASAQATARGIAPQLPATLDWPGLSEKLTEMLRTTPHLRFLKFELSITNSGASIQRMLSVPAMPTTFPLSRCAAALIESAAVEKEQDWSSPQRQVAKLLRNGRLKTRRVFASIFFPAGLVPYQATRWPADILRDLAQDTGVSVRDKLWAYREGFLSYRLPQYGITRSNRNEFVSDFEYRWVRHINNDFREWFEDKMTLKYLFPSYQDLFPAYYFHVEAEGAESIVTRLMDCPRDIEPDLDGLLRLIREVGTVAVKPDEGSHGEGFFRLDFEDGRFSRNGERVPEKDLRHLLSKPGASYLVSEFVHAHPELARLYPKALPTMRLLVYKPDGKTPVLGNTYLRLGSSRSGFVDNLAAGGMVADINPETGEFGHGETLVKGRIRPQVHHPDTGLLVQGVIPGWRGIVDTVIDLADQIPELEYLGFDVAVTSSGMKVIEINRSPDYPRTNLIPKQFNDYLLGRVAAKTQRTRGGRCGAAVSK